MIEVFRPAHPHRTRHPRHFSGQRKVSVPMCTTWRGPGSASAGWCFPGLNQKASKAGWRTDPFRSSGRPLKAEKAAALPPRSAPRSEHAARCEGSVSETPCAAVGSDAPRPAQNHPAPAPPGEKAQPKQKASQRRGGRFPKCSTWNISQVRKSEKTMFHVEHFEKTRSVTPRNSHYI